MVFVSCAVGMPAIAPDEQRAPSGLRDRRRGNTAGDGGLGRGLSGKSPAARARRPGSACGVAAVPLGDVPQFGESAPAARRICWTCVWDRDRPAASRQPRLEARGSCRRRCILRRHLRDVELAASPSVSRALSQAIRGQPSAGQPAASTLGDTWRAMVAVERTPTAGPGSIRGAEVGYYSRWSWPFATFALGLLALSLIHCGRTVQSFWGLWPARPSFFWCAGSPKSFLGKHPRAQRRGMGAQLVFFWGFFFDNKDEPNPTERGRPAPPPRPRRKEEGKWRRDLVVQPLD